MEQHLTEGQNANAETKASYDPGWNDPPLFSYDTVNTAVQAKTPKKGLLNKRVAFPMSSQGVTGSPLPSSSGPPVMPPSSVAPPPAVAVLPPAPPPQENVSKTEPTDQTFDKVEALQKIIQNFEEILSGGSDDLKRNGVEIRRRVDIMKKMWEEDKLKPEICIKMVQLSEALVTGNGRSADSIHVALMVDHISLCSPWMVGVKQLIHYVKSQTTNSETQEEPVEGIPTYEQILNSE